MFVTDIKLVPIFPRRPTVGRPGEGEFAKCAAYGRNGGCFVHFEVNWRDPRILRNPNGADPGISSQAMTTPARHDLQRVVGNDVEWIALAAGGNGSFQFLFFR